MDKARKFSLMPVLIGCAGLLLLGTFLKPHCDAYVYSSASGGLDIRETGLLKCKACGNDTWDRPMVDGVERYRCTKCGTLR